MFRSKTAEMAGKRNGERLKTDFSGTEWTVFEPLTQSSPLSMVGPDHKGGNVLQDG